MHYLEAESYIDGVETLCKSGYYNDVKPKKMSIFDTIKSFSFDKNEKHIFGIKSGIVWGNSNKSNSSSPLLYITKPKHISTEEYKELLDSIDIQFIKK